MNEQETQVTKWTVITSPAGKKLFCVDENNMPFLLDANAMINSGYQGKAFVATDPGSLNSDHKGYWYFCGETGDFVNFDNTTANKNDQLWWNGSAWDLIPTGSVTSGSKYESVATEGQTVFVLDQQLTADDVVNVNGKDLFSTNYEGEGTLNLTFFVGLDLYDKVIVKHA